MEIKEMLPIGSIVMLKNGKKKIMITGYLAASDKSEDMYDYTACFFPEGFISSDKILLFNHEQIEEIYFLGYNNSESSEYRENVKNILNAKQNLINDSVTADSNLI